MIWELRMTEGSVVEAGGGVVAAAGAAAGAEAAVSGVAAAAAGVWLVSLGGSADAPDADSANAIKAKRILNILLT